MRSSQPAPFQSITTLDRDGRLPEFMHYFHALLARCQNSYRGRWENFWASGGPSSVELVDPADSERAVV